MLINNLWCKITYYEYCEAGRGGASLQALAWTAKGSSIFALKKTRAFWSKRQQGFQRVSSWYRRTVCCTYEYCSLQTKLLGVRYYFSRHIVHTYVTYCMYIHTISLLTVPVLAGVCWSYVTWTVKLVFAHRPTSACPFWQICILKHPPPLIL